MQQILEAPVLVSSHIGLTFLPIKLRPHPNAQDVGWISMAVELSWKFGVGHLGCWLSASSCSISPCVHGPSGDKDFGLIHNFHRLRLSVLATSGPSATRFFSIPPPLNPGPLHFYPLITAIAIYPNSPHPFELTSVRVNFISIIS